MPEYYENFNLTDIVSPVNVDIFKKLLEESCYDPAETRFWVDSFHNGFDLGYRGPENVRREANNLRIRVGSYTILWNKVMKEVKLGRYAGPFKSPPFDEFIQSPIGLVPKGHDDTRLIFHLSYPRGGSSINSETPRDMCIMQYCDFAQVI